ncbi:MAG TPA: hypothetical protein VJ803_01680 [Gemmatimonadaceae bacterium]|nr:hypothetical protein [Gemmatimonadaceae bacterium]
MHASSAHPVDDGDLVRLIDGEATDAVSAHVAACGSCTARLQEMRARLTRLSPLLRDLDVATPPLATPEGATLRLVRAERWISRLWRLAAAVVLVVGLAVSPLGAWVATQLARVTAALTSDRDAGPPASPDAAPEPEGRATVVYFQPAGAELIVRLDARPSGGSLSVERADRASAQIVRANAGESLVVLPSELRIRNTSESSADYLLTLPASLRTLRVRVDGQPASRDVILDLTATPRHTVSLGATP